MNGNTHILLLEKRGLSPDSVFSEYATFIRKCIGAFFASIGRRYAQDEIEEVFQDTALKILRNNYLDRFDARKSSLNTWLGMIARTTAIDHLRRGTPEVSDLDRDIPVSTDFEARLEPLPLPDGLLTDRQRQVLELAFEHGLDAGEIANRLDVARPTVRSIKRQALARLRNHYIHEQSAPRDRRTMS